MANMACAREALIQKRVTDFSKLKPSEMLAAAIDDLEQVEQNPKYIINMLVWQSPRQDNTCAVCFAGAVMANRIGTQDEADWLPGGGRVLGFTCALNQFRVGNIQEGLEYLNIKKPWQIPSIVSVEDYAINPTLFKTQMRAVAKQLDKHGL